MQQEKAERITITLPRDMLSSIKQKVSSGSYGSTSELIREAMRLWQKKEEEREVRLALIRNRLEKSKNNGEPVPIEKAFSRIEELHKRKLKGDIDG